MRLTQTRAGRSRRLSANTLVTGLQNGTETRDTVLRKIAEDNDFKTSQSNRAFCPDDTSDICGRNPTEAPDTDFTGYDFWLTKLNQFNGNFIQAEMVKAFIISTEYRARFGSQ